ncbi:MAG: TylF/MycF/NovP-related O-methyltransferase [Hyphomicrobiaceae bacterium]
MFLDSIEKSLVGRLNCDAPLPGGDHAEYNDTYRENGWDWPSGAPSMIGAKRMHQLRCECERVIRERVPGDFLETGIWRGGALIMMRAVLAAYGIKNRRAIGADSFAGLPPPTGIVPDDAADRLLNRPEFSVSLEEVEATVARYGLLDDQVVLLKGLFKDTLPVAPVDTLAVLRLDGDMYDSTMDGLTNLYHKVSPRGSVIVDDYFLFEAQRTAVDEYRARNGIKDTIHKIDDFGAYWVKQGDEEAPK